ncbi:MAG TPA: NAD(P)-dependent oxidoreductase [Bacteroidetes bacterium]|nr:NAD(P)-dependent oxidoreductase [Bacteroidota bacterium]
MKIIITGATGSLGAYLTRHFAAAGHEVIASGRVKKPPESLLRFATYLQADITRPCQFPQADACIHTAALSDDKGKPKDLYEANVVGTKNVAEAARGCPVFLHISSSSVYLPTDQPIKENLAGQQDNKLLSPYGLSKLQAEEMLLQTTRHPACFVLRPRALYGAGDKVILPRMLKLVHNDILYCPGKMEVKLSLTHYSTLAKALECCLEKPAKKGVNIYNVADSQTYVLIGIMRQLTRQLYGKTLKERRIPIGLLKGLALFQLGGVTPLLVRSFTKDMVLDISKIRSELGFAPEATYTSTLKNMGEWVEEIGGVEVIKTGGKGLAWKGLPTL